MLSYNIFRINSNLITAQSLLFYNAEATIIERMVLLVKKTVPFRKDFKILPLGHRITVR